MKSGTIKTKNIAGQSYPSIWVQFGHPGETLDGRHFCMSKSLEWLTAFYLIYDEQHANDNCRPQVADSNSFGFNSTLNDHESNKEKVGVGLCS